MSNLNEAQITINGTALTNAQSMAVRVAITNFLMELHDDRTLADLGAIGIAYHQRLNEVIRMIGETQ